MLPQNQRLFLFGALILFFCYHSNAQTGPGGVGDTTTLKVWLRSTDIEVGNGNEIAIWRDTSGHNHDFTGFAGSGGSQPTWDSTAINGLPGILFHGDAARFEDDDGEDYINGNSGVTLITLIQSDELATVDVGIFDAEDPDGNDEILTWRYDNDGFFGGGDNVIKFGLDATSGNGQFESANETHTVNPQLLVGTWSSNDSCRLFLDGVQSVPTYHNAIRTGAIVNATKAIIGRGPKDDATSGWNGYIVEFALYDYAVNSVERMLIENYLAAKYDLSVSNDLYAFQTNHGNDLVGVGQSGADIDTSAVSDNILGLEIVDANLDSGDWVLYGHDGGDITSWVTAEQPLGDSNFVRLTREWRFDTTGTPGVGKVSIDTTYLPSKTTDFDYYYLWTDDDGDFTTGATAHLLTKNDSVYEASGLAISDGMYAAISLYRPVIEFSSNSSSGFESTTNVDVFLSIPYATYQNITVDYADNGSGTATGSGTDYTLTSGTATLLSGNTTDTISFTVSGAQGSENDETVVIDLSSPSGAVLGPDSLFTYTIHDDDGTRQIEFLSPCNFGYKKSITINSSQVAGSANLTDFIMLVNISSDNDLRTIGNGGHVSSSNGYDVRFTYGDSLEWLEHELESYNASTGAYIAWVKIPTLDYNDDTQLTMYYGNSSISGDPSASIWSGYNGVWHLENSLDDASGNAQNGTNNSSTNATSGIIGDCREFSGTNQSFDISESVIPTTGDFSISFWFNADDNTTGQNVLYMSNTGADKYFNFNFNASQMRWAFEDAVDDDMTITYGTAPTLNTWHFVTVIGEWNSADHAIYVDGVARAQALIPFAGIFTNRTDIRVGEKLDNGYAPGAEANDFDGTLDELRVFAGEISVDVHATEYNNQNSPGTFYSVSSEQTNNCSGSEDVLVAKIIIGVSTVDGSSATTVDYAVTGGTASTNDYILSSGTLNISAGDSIGTVDLAISNDLIDEQDETVIITLSNPTNANLGSNTSFTYTIEDNDNQPSIDFTTTSVTVNEGSSTANLSVQLSGISGRDVTVGYSVTSSTATSGVDYILPDGTLTISAGNQSGKIILNLIDDPTIEAPESIVIDLSSPTGATLGSDSIITVTLNDNDNDGFNGPGGVGSVDGSGSLVQWLIADSASADGGNSLTDWDNVVDLSGLNMDTVSSNRPTKNANAINGHAEVSFANVNDVLISSSVLSASTFPYDEATIFVVSRSDDRGQESQLFTTANSSSGTVPASPRLTGAIPEDDTVYFWMGNSTNGSEVLYQSAWLGGAFSVFCLQSDNSDDSTFIFRNNEQLVSTSGVTPFTNHNTYNLYLGRQGNDPFQGDIAEFVIYKGALNDAQIKIINNYLGAKYDISLTDDLYVWNSTHGNDVAGIGQESSTEFHVKAKAGIVTISNASTLGDGDYMLVWS